MRIYDNFAQIFGGYSECIAIAKIGEQIYIAVNEIDKSSNESKKVSLIKDSQKLVSGFLAVKACEEEEIRDFCKARNDGREYRSIKKSLVVRANLEACQTNPPILEIFRWFYVPLIR